MRLLAATFVVSVVVCSAPSGADAAAVTYTGTEDLPARVTVDGAKVTALSFFATLHCTDGSSGNYGIDTLRFPRSVPVTVSGGHFTVSGAQGDGNGLTWNVDGTLAGRTITLTAHAEAHEFSGVTPQGPLCSVDKTMVLHAPRAQRPAKSRPAGPDVYESLAAVRTNDARHYFVAATGMRCTGGATDVVFTVAGATRTVSCRHRAAIVSREIIPHHAYTVAVRPVRKHGGRVIRRGTRSQVSVYVGGDEISWTPISGLHFPGG